MDRAALQRPFPQDAIKTRRGPFGQDLCYVEAPMYIRRLNEALDGQWDFTIEHHDIRDTEVIVVGKLTAGGITKMAFGGSAITTARGTGEVVSVADDLKAASTDALKKCCSLLGIGLDLYLSSADSTAADAPARPARPLRSVPPERPSNGTANEGGAAPDDRSRLTAKQLKAIFAVGHAHGLSEADLKKEAIAAYGVAPAYLSREDASSFITALSGR